jgi:predicted alpha/beta hydrolase
MSAFPEASLLESTLVMPVTATDGARSELICTQLPYPKRVVYWLPAMGVPAKHYLPLAEAFAAHGTAVALHEWRGIGSSDRRASRRDDWGYRELLQADIAAGMATVAAHWPNTTCWIGGHSLGGQLACLYASLHRHSVAGIALVASGAPYWRNFAFGPMILAAYALSMPLAKLMGHLPGRRIGFGGNEARGVIADWSRSGRTGRYAAQSVAADFERQLAALRMPVLALRLRDDWLAPSSSLAWLLDKMPQTPQRTGVITPEDLAGQPADHFTWMKTPASVVATLATWMDTAQDLHT